MSAGTRRESPAWQAALAEALVEALPRLLAEPADPLIAELISALTAALCRGELDLSLKGPAPEGISPASWPEGHRRALAASRLCRDPDGPLSLQGDRIAWRRWHQRQEGMVAALLERAAAPQPAPGPLSAPGSDATATSSRPDGAAPAGSGASAVGTAREDPDLSELDPIQRRAVEAALERRLVLLLGGPGTGKTRTVAALLQVLRSRDAALRVQLAAPTGKAAARLRAATAGRETCTTLHRLLESQGGRFGRHRHNPLQLDLLVVDEVSMLDLELMEALLDALPPSCRLVLVGDPAQLPPVAPGSALLALLDHSLATELAPACFELLTTYRNDGAIARVADALRLELGSAAAAAAAHDPPIGTLQRLRPWLAALHPSDNLGWQDLPPGPLPDLLLERLRQHRQRLWALAERCWPDSEEGWRELLVERDRLLVLAPQRRGRWGIEAIHRALLPAGSEAVPSAWPGGTPVLCRRNLPELDLANGDIGVLVERRVPGAQPQRRVLFGDHAPLWRHPAQLVGALEPAFALTVHKAQGSEALEVILLLDQPEELDPRLLYTGLTRARRQALLLTAGASSQAAASAAISP